MNSDLKIIIPFPYKHFTDTKFILTSVKDNLFIPDDLYYYLNEREIIIPNPSDINIDKDTELRFTFIHQKNQKYIGKEEYHFIVSDLGIKEFFLPQSPYQSLIDLEKRIFVFYNRSRLDKTSYTFDNSSGKILLMSNNLSFLVGDRLDIIIIYTANHKNKAINQLPESGYIYLSKYELDRNYNPDLMAVFVNGKLIDKEDILKLNNNVYKIKEDIKSRYNIEIKNLSPKIQSLIPFYKNHCLNITEEEDKKINKDLYCKIEVPNINIKKNRQNMKTLLNPIYFPPYIVQEDCYINFILKGNKKINFNIKFYGNDYTNIYEDKIYLLLQLRLMREREFIDNSKSVIMIGTIDGYYTNPKEDTILNSVKMSKIVEMDYERNNTSINGILGRLQANPNIYNSKEPLYYKMQSNKIQNNTSVNVFEWTITSEIDNQGKLYYRKLISLEPDNKLSLL